MELNGIEKVKMQLRKQTYFTCYYVSLDPSLFAIILVIFKYRMTIVWERNFEVLWQPFINIQRLLTDKKISFKFLLRLPILDLYSSFGKCFKLNSLMEIIILSKFQIESFIILGHN
jgi:hypothetical protein